MKFKTIKINNPKEFAEKTGEAIFGIKPSEAKAQGICIQCKEPAIPKCYSEAGRREFQISGLCEKCFDEITGG